MGKKAELGRGIREEAETGSRKEREVRGRARSWLELDRTRPRPQ